MELELPSIATPVRAPSLRLARRLAREPLLHFAILGGLLAALHQFVLAPPAPRRIDVSPSVRQGLRQDYLRRNGTAPTQEQEAALVANYIDSEVLYREALALGLDRGDIIVRRRLVQKMEFVLDNMEPIPAPSDAALEQHLVQHASRYAVPARATFTHVFISRERHGSGTAAVADRLSAALQAGADPASLGDPFLHGSQFTQRSEPEIAQAFGPAFAASLLQLQPGAWSAPIASSYGVHLVRLTDVSAAHAPALAAVRETVTRDWEEEQRAAAARRAVERLRDTYDVRVGEAP